MADQKLNAKGSLTNSQFNDNTKIIPIATVADGQVFTGTIAQAKLIFGSHYQKYIATGSEGTSVTIAGLIGMEVGVIIRESGVIFPILSSPASTEFSFNAATGTITLGASTNPSERFLIIYKYA
jgi:hypothetical protein